MFSNVTTAKAAPFNALLATLRRLAECRRGMAALEVALVMPPFLLLCFGFVGVNAALYTRSTMQNAAQLAARMMATGQVTSFTSGAISGALATNTATCAAGMAAGTVEAVACTGLPGWATFTVTATQDCAVPSVSVQINASAFTAAAGDRFDMLLGKTITARAVMMKEGTCS
jgi:Flp pilus assembly protein TadG